MEEVWKDIEGYEGLYSISNNGIVRNSSGKTLKPFITNDGYFRVSLSRDSTRKHYLVHRLVAIAFIPNPMCLPIINHKDENKKNNTIYVNSDGSVDVDKSNLEWCTYSYNIRYGNHFENRGRFERTPVKQFDLSGNFICRFSSLHEAEKKTGICSCNISLCCKGSDRYKHAGGYIWKFDNDDSPIRLLRKVVQISRNGEVAGVFNTIDEASKKTGIHPSSIRNCLSGRSRSAGNYIWKINVQEVCQI